MNPMTLPSSCQSLSVHEITEVTRVSPERRRRARIADSVLLLGVGAVGSVLTVIGGALGTGVPFALPGPLALIIGTLAFATNTRDRRAQVAAALACTTIAALPVSAFLLLRDLPTFSPEALVSLSQTPRVQRLGVAWGVAHIAGTWLVGSAVGSFTSARDQRVGRIVGLVLVGIALATEVAVALHTRPHAEGAHPGRYVAAAVGLLHVWLATFAYRAYRTFVR